MNNPNTEIDTITHQFRQTFGDLSSEQLNWKSDPSRWSVAQNIDHIMVINNSYVPVIDAVRNGTYKRPFMGRIGFLVSLFGDFILKGVNPDRKNKTRTFPVWEPTQSDLPDDILNRFEQHQEALKALIHNSADLVAKGVVISSPANRNIVYTLEKAFEIIITHEKRHFEQAKEVLQQIQKTN